MTAPDSLLTPVERQALTGPAAPTAWLDQQFFGDQEPSTFVSISPSREDAAKMAVVVCNPNASLNALTASLQISVDYPVARGMGELAGSNAQVPLMGLSGALDDSFLWTLCVYVKHVVLKPVLANDILLKPGVWAVVEAVWPEGTASQSNLADMRQRRQDWPNQKKVAAYALWLQTSDMLFLRKDIPDVRRAFELIRRLRSDAGLRVSTTWEALGF